MTMMRSMFGVYFRTGSLVALFDTRGQAWEWLLHGVHGMGSVHPWTVDTDYEVAEVLVEVRQKASA